MKQSGLKKKIEPKWTHIKFEKRKWTAKNQNGPNKKVKPCENPKWNKKNQNQLWNIEMNQNEMKKSDMNCETKK